MGRTVTILGATGLIGSHLLDILLEDPSTEKVIALVRKATLPLHDKLEQYVINFQDPKAYEPYIIGSETVFTAIGTTNAKVDGDQNEYRKVDYDIPVNAARAAAKFSVYAYVMVSAVMADPNNNNNFYLKLKGVTEETICEQKIPQIYIMRPSLILGERRERRITEKMAQVVAPLFSWALGGSRTKYKPIQAEDVAMSMFKASTQGTKGIHICEYKEMMRLCSL
jgi:uncharacterized protein YbjT (DUF2867 family)